MVTIYQFEVFNLFSQFKKPDSTKELFEAVTYADDIDTQKREFVFICLTSKNDPSFACSGPICSCHKSKSALLRPQNTKSYMTF